MNTNKAVTDVRSLLFILLIISLMVTLPVNFIPSVQASPDQITLRPNAAGDLTEHSVVGASANWNACWSDDGDDSYVRLTPYTFNDRHDLYHLDNFSQPDAIITSVVIKIKSKWEYDSNVDVKIKIKLGNGSVYESSTISLTNSYAEYGWNVTDKDDWTQAKLNALQAGMHSSPHGSTGGLRHTVLWVEVIYTPPSPPAYSNFGFNIKENKLSGNISIIGQPLEVFCYWSTSSGNLSYYIVEENNTGSFKNHTYPFPSGQNSAWSNATPINELNYTVGVKIRLKIFANNTGGKWNVTSPPKYVTATILKINDEIQWVFSRSVERAINETFPYVRGYDEVNGLSSKATAGDMFSGVQFYLITGNQTYLDWTYKVANWLNNTSDDPKDAFSTYIVDQGFSEDDPMSASSAGGILMSLCQLVKVNLRHMSLLNKIANAALNYFVPTDTYRIQRAVYRDGTVKDSWSKTSDLSLACGLAWAYNITGNDTYRDAAVRLCVNYSLSPIHIPYHGVDQDGGQHLPQDSGWYGTKLEGFGHLGMALASVYYFTRNDTVKDKLNETTWYYSHYAWNETSKRFMYRINSTDGTVCGGVEHYSTHSFAMVEQALFLAYLLTGNTTWRDKARSDFDHLALIKNTLPNNDILKRNLVTHSSSGASYGVNTLWSFMTPLSALTSSNYYSNKSYLEAFNKLYAAYSFCVGTSSKGYYSSIEIPQPGEEDNDWDVYTNPVASLGLVSYWLNNRTGTIQNFDDYFEVIGDSRSGKKIFWGYDLDLQVKDWDMSDPISGAKVCKDSDVKTSDVNGWANFSEITGGSTVSVSVYYFGYPVNGSFSVTVDNYKTIAVRCKLYDAYFHLIDDIGNPVSGANVTAFNTTALSHQITSGSTNSTGYAYLKNLPNSTSLPIAVYYPDNQTLRAKTTRNISSDEVVTSDITVSLFLLITLYKVRLDLIEDFYEGSNLVAVFYDYQNQQGANVTVWSITPPEHVTLSIDILHPLNKGVENVTLVLTDDIGDIIRTVTGFLVSRPALMQRISEIDAQWVNATEEQRSILFRELVDIDVQWAYAPS